jgi:PPM family protein phosphatase
MNLFRRLFNQAETDEKDTLEVVPTTLPVRTENNSPGDEVKAPSSTDTQSFVADGATRPLPMEAVISSHNNHLIFGQSTDVGMVRTNNQDAALSFFFTSRSAEDRPDFGLFIVADGMGGHHDGEKASAMTARIVASQVTSNIYLPILSGENDSSRPPITEALISAVQKANSEVITLVPEGGTTLTAVAVIGDLAYVAHVGDSRVYLIAKEGIEQLTRDHSLVQRLKELDQITEDEMKDHPQKNVLYRAIGQSESLEVDAISRRLPPNSRLLVCSDGLWNQVDSKDILDIVLNNHNPQEACDKLVALANTRGGPDNITAILLQIPSN